jgi:bifunctional pyridoxal-dependent enzyme with beta-cystathionase and maltose regulon repressor activities
LGPKADLEKAKVHVVPGELFGVPGFIRMNLAFKEEIMQEILNRINGTST